MMQSKKALRTCLRKVLSAFCNDKDKVIAESLAVQEMLVRSQVWMAAPVILLYKSTPHEIMTAALISLAIRQGRRVALPRVTSKTDMVFDYTDGTNTCIGSVDTLPLDALIVSPGMAFTKDGWRLGHGGGYYDRYIAKHPCRTVGICFSCQLLEAIPHEAHDMKVERVFSPYLVH